MYHQLRAAKGFLELGDPDSAWEELEKIPTAERAHPVVLWTILEIYRAKKRWEAMVEVARHLVEHHPENPHHWLDLAWGQRRGMDLQSAERTLLKAVEMFPTEATIHYNLACYSCQLGRIQEAKEKLAKAIDMEPALKISALEDEDLKAIW